MDDPAERARGVRMTHGGVLDLYEEPYDPERSVVCFDERPCQLLADLTKPLPVGPGLPERRDHEYERRGTANVLTAFETLTGWRRAEVTERRRGREFALVVRRLAEEAYPHAERIRLVCDNLFTHSAGPSTRPSFQRRHAGWRSESSSATRQCMAPG